MNNLKKNENKGFTLVELIVVLVILAILAAILVPALLGYIDRAKQQQIVLNARSCYTAAQAEMSTLYGTGRQPSEVANNTHKTQILDTADVPNCQGLVIGCEVAYNASETDKGKIHKMYTIKYVAYTEGGKTIYFDGTSWVDEEPTSAKVANAFWTIK